MTELVENAGKFDGGLSMPVVLGCVADGTKHIDVAATGPVLLNTLVTISPRCVRLTIQNLGTGNIEIGYMKTGTPTTGEMAVLESKKAMQFQWASADLNRLWINSLSGTQVVYVWQEAMV